MHSARHSQRRRPPKTGSDGHATTVHRRPTVQTVGTFGNPSGAIVMKLVRYGCVVSSLTLTACSGIPANVDALDVDITTALAQDSMIGQEGADAPLAVDVSTGFKPALRAALFNNQGYKAALSLEKEAAAGISVAASAGRPQITGDTTVGAIYESDPVSDTTTGVSGGLRLSQMIYDGGAMSGAVNRATAETVAARAERLERGNTVILEAGRAWLDVWQYRERIAWLNAKTAEMDGVVQQIERMASTGMLDRAALDSAKRQIVDIELERKTLQSGFEDAKSRFKRYFGTEPGPLNQPDVIMTGQAAQERAQHWKTAPRLRRSAAELVSAQAALTEAEAAFKPTVSLQTGVMSPMNTDDTTDVSAGFRVEYTFGDGGRRVSQLEAATARVESLTARLADEQYEAEAQSRAALDKLMSIERSMPLLAEKISLSASEAKTARSQIATGQSNLRQLVEAEIQHYRARDQEIRMQAELRLLLLEIAAGTGDLIGLVGAAKQT